MGVAQLLPAAVSDFTRSRYTAVRHHYATRYWYAQCAIASACWLSE